MLRIGIDCRTILHPQAQDQAGIAHYTFGLVSALIRKRSSVRWVLFFPESMRGKTNDFERRNVEIAILPPAGRLPVVHRHLGFSSFVQKAQLDLFHGPANILPIPYRGRSVVTMHDLAIYAHPEWFPSGQTFSKKVVVPRSVKLAKKIIAVSKATEKDLVERFRVPKEKIRVIYEGGIFPSSFLRDFKKSKSDIRKRFHIDQSPYILFLGTIEPRKNLVRAIQAFNLLLKSMPRLRKTFFILAGARGWKENEILREVARSPFGHQIKMVGRVSHAEKIDLMRHAKVFFFPSLWEGFGLPVVEAMACGAPVVTSSVASLPEVGGRAVAYANPSSVQALTKALLRVLMSPERQTELRQKGRRRTRIFTWERAAEKTLQLYYECLS